MLRVFAKCLSPNGLFHVLMFCRTIGKHFTTVAFRLQCLRSHSAFSIVHKRRTFCQTNAPYQLQNSDSQSGQCCQCNLGSATLHLEQLCRDSNGRAQDFGASLALAGVGYKHEAVYQLQSWAQQTGSRVSDVICHSNLY